MATDTTDRVEDIAHELFQVVTQICLSTLRGRRPAGDLKEVEFLTLSLLQDHGSMIVGDIQRVLSVLPAQMSRVIRSLENRERPLIQCSINPRDKRKIDVELDRILYPLPDVGQVLRPIACPPHEVRQLRREIGGVLAGARADLEHGFVF